MADKGELIKKMMDQKKKGKEEEEIEEDEEMMPEDGFKYASENVAKMMGKMAEKDGEESEGAEEGEQPSFETVELTVDGNTMSGNALVDFVLENQDAIRATDKSEE